MKLLFNILLVAALAGVMNVAAAEKTTIGEVSVVDNAYMVNVSIVNTGNGFVGGVDVIFWPPSGEAGTSVASQDAVIHSGNDSVLLYVPELKSGRYEVALRDANRKYIASKDFEPRKSGFIALISDSHNIYVLIVILIALVAGYFLGLSARDRAIDKENSPVKQEHEESVEEDHGH